MGQKRKLSHPPHMHHACGPLECAEIHNNLISMWNLNGSVGCALSFILVAMDTQPVSFPYVAIIPSDTLKLLKLFKKISIFLLCFESCFNYS